MAASRGIKFQQSWYYISYEAFYRTLYFNTVQIHTHLKAVLIFESDEIGSENSFCIFERYNNILFKINLYMSYYKLETGIML